VREKLLQAFRGQFDSEAEFIVRAPGRVNLIGEHTDYNDGFVMPLAIERATWLALRRRTDGRVVLHSTDFGDSDELDLASVNQKEANGASWSGYLRGVAWSMNQRFSQLDGWEGVSMTNIPIGSGLSSSASFELAVAGAFAAAGDLEWDAKRMAVICHKAEVEWVGVNCGMMDHLASAEGKAGYALLIDCRSLESRPIPLPSGLLVVILDTGKPRTLAGSAYNERRAQCEEASRLLGVNSLRDASLDMLERGKSSMSSVIYQRARHVITENDRTLRAATAMQEGDSTLLGNLMVESHQSLRDDYEVSCRELDLMVEASLAVEGCVGARMTGAGFGGCAVALVEENALEDFLARVSRTYQSATGIEPKLYASIATDGVEVDVVSPEAAGQA
jgi:galactokinase